MDIHEDQIVTNKQNEICDLTQHMT